MDEITFPYTNLNLPYHPAPTKWPKKNLCSYWYQKQDLVLPLGAGILRMNVTIPTKPRHSALQIEITNNGTFVNKPGDDSPDETTPHGEDAQF